MFWYVFPVMEFGTTFQFSTANAINCNLSVTCPKSTSSTVLLTDLTKQRSAINQPGLRASAVIIAIANCCYSPLDLNLPLPSETFDVPDLVVCMYAFHHDRSYRNYPRRVWRETKRCLHAKVSAVAKLCASLEWIATTTHARTHACYLITSISDPCKSLAACIGRRVWPFAYQQRAIFCC